MSEEIKIITLGDIFDNIETEEKAFKFKDYIKDLQQKVEQLEKELNQEKEEYAGLHKVLNNKEEEFGKENYNNVVEINRLKRKVEQLEKENKRLKEWKEDLLSENVELENIRKEAIEWIDEHDYYSGSSDIYYFSDFTPSNNLLNILNKGSEKE